MVKHLSSIQYLTNAVNSLLSMCPDIDENPEYWGDYNNLQREKHELLKKYLGGWFPILGSWSGRIVYIDCNAGRGKHETGQPGSPVIALKTLLFHPACERILKNCEVFFFFIEAAEENKAHLEQYISGFPCPAKVKIKVRHGRFEEVLQAEILNLRKQNSQMAPAFVFVDPYGFKLPGRLLAELKAFDKCELFITFMWRWIDMAMRNPDHAENMDALFITDEWRKLLDILDPDQRCEGAIRLLCSKLGAKYFTRVKMLGENQAIKYVLIHATNHPKGRQLMLDAMWKICPTGGFKVRINDNPNQEYLITPSPDLTPLKDWLLKKYKGKIVRVEALYSAMDDPADGTFYLRKHLHATLTEMWKMGEITCSGKLVFSRNPEITFSPSKTDQYRSK